MPAGLLLLLAAARLGVGVGVGAEVPRCTWLGPETLVEEADRAAAAGTMRICLAAAGRGPGQRDLARIAGAIAAIRERRADLYHNLNTSEGRNGEILHDSLLRGSA